jgi:hypothetical protein
MRGALEIVIHLEISIVGVKIAFGDLGLGLCSSGPDWLLTLKEPSICSVDPLCCKFVDMNTKDDLNSKLLVVSQDVLLKRFALSWHHRLP